MKRIIFPIVALFATVFSGIAQDALPHQMGLQGFLKYALENNYDIQNAKELIEEQEGLIVEVKAAILPNASIVGNYSIKENSLVYGGVTPGTGANENWGLSLEISQLVYSGGGIRASLKAQDFSRESVRHGLTTVVNQVVYDVRLAFYNSLLAREQIKVEEKNIDYLKEQLKTAQDRFSVDSVSKLDVLRAEVEVANAQPALIRARNNYRNAIDLLYQLVGAQARVSHVYDGSEIAGSLEYTNYPYSLQQSVEQALSTRPDLLQAQTVIKAYEAGVDVAKAGYFPTVSLYGGFDYDKNPMSDRMLDSLDGWSVGVRSSWAIFDGRRTKGQLIQANSRLRQAELAEKKLSLRVGVDVRQAMSSLQEAQELADAGEKVVEQAEEALRLAEVRYEAGAATQVELLESTYALTQAETNLLSANFSYLAALAQMARAKGETSF